MLQVCNATTTTDVSNLPMIHDLMFQQRMDPSIRKIPCHDDITLFLNGLFATNGLFVILIQYCTLMIYLNEF